MWVRNTLSTSVGFIPSASRIASILVCPLNSSTSSS